MAAKFASIKFSIITPTLEPSKAIFPRILAVIIILTNVAVVGHDHLATLRQLMKILQLSSCIDQQGFPIFQRIITYIFGWIHHFLCFYLFILQMNIYLVISNLRIIELPSPLTSVLSFLLHRDSVKSIIRGLVENETLL